ncbi:hypothetical protein [Burkholderia ubonensis]|nr:hypothetical protein [Burkholderia ubonensis]
MLVAVEPLASDHHSLTASIAGEGPSELFLTRIETNAWVGQFYSMYFCS